ncbi:MAG: hypothetical protein ACLP59_09205 [Bryobacteraceae bacterium]
MVGTGNGGFQVDSGSGNAVNFGESVIGFDVTTTCPTTMSTTQSCAPASSSSFFTPNCWGRGGPSYSACTSAVHQHPQYFTMSLNDQDMATPGMALTSVASPTGNKVLVTFGKDGTGYALDTGSLGGFSGGTTADNAVGEFYGSTSSPLCVPGSGCTPANPNSNNSGYNYPCAGSAAGSNPPYTNGQCDMITSQVYWHYAANGGQDYLFVFPTNEDLVWCYWDSTLGANGNFSCTPDATADPGDHLSPVGHPGGSMVLALDNGATSPLDSAVLWVLAFEQGVHNQPYIDPGTCRSYGCLHGYLRAYALSGDNGDNDADLWTGSPLSQITVINGRLYVPTYDSGVRVYDNWGQ